MGFYVSLSLMAMGYHPTFVETSNYKILVEGKDKAGNEIKFERKIFVDSTDPEVEIIAKPKRVVDKDTKTVKVKIKVWENSGDIKVYRKLF